MASINLIVDEIVGALDRPLDVQLKDRLRAALRHEIATVIQQDVTNSGIKDVYRTVFGLEVGIFDDSESSFPLDQEVWRTFLKVPKPLNYKTGEPFIAVGNRGLTVIYLYSQLEELPYADIPKAYDLKPVRYNYRNDYIYLYNYDGTYDNYIVNGGGETLPPGGIDPPPVGQIGVDYIWVNGIFGISDIITNEGQLSNDFVNDDSAIPVSEDRIQHIKARLLQGELAIIDNKDKLSPEHMDN